MKDSIQLTGLSRGTLKRLCKEGYLGYIILENGYHQICKEDIFKLVEWQCENRPIKDFEDYTISEYGEIRKVRGKKAPCIMKCGVDKDGYYKVALVNNKGKFYFRVHRLVAMTYIENTLNFPVVNHKDGNVKNNHISNLEWCSISYNTRHGFACNGRKGNTTTNKPCTLYKNKIALGNFESLKSLIEFYKTLESEGHYALRTNLKYREYTIEIISND